MGAGEGGARGVFTFDGLRGEEIVRCHLERGGGGSALLVFGNCLREILQDRSAGELGMICQQSG